MCSSFGILSTTGPMAASARVRRPGVAVTLIGSALLFSAGLYLGMPVLANMCVCVCLCVCVCVSVYADIIHLRSKLHAVTKQD